MSQLAIFQIRLAAIDKPTDRRRWNGGPMASDEASEALHEVVDWMQAVLEERGFEVARTTYGVHAEEIEP